MLRVVKDKPTEEIRLSELKDIHIIGVMDEKGHKGQIVKISGQGYILVTIMNNSYSSKVKFESIQKVIDNSFSGKKQAFVFESELEYINWLASDYDLYKGELIEKDQES